MDVLLNVDPNLIYLLLIFGLWSGVTASYIPGTGFTEVITLGALGVSVAYLWQDPSTNWLAVLVLSVGVLTFITFPFLPRRWRDYTLVGFALQALGSWFLFASNPLNPVLILVVLGLQLLYHRVLLVPVLERMRDQKAEKTRDEQIIGQNGRMTSALDPGATHPFGSVMVNSESWSASSDYVLAEGEAVRVIQRQGLRLKVEPLVREKEKTDHMGWQESAGLLGEEKE